jgi:hypothetical protein
MESLTEGEKKGCWLKLSGNERLILINELT